jgi:class 3 adenylate cyclase
VVVAPLPLVFRRGWFAWWVPLAMPIIDGLIITTGGLELVRTGVAVYIDYSPEVCTLLAVSGGLRLRRRAAVMTTSVALATYWVLAIMMRQAELQIAFSSVVIFAAGMLGGWLSFIVRRALEGEVGRTTLARFLPLHVVDGAHEDPLRLLARPQAIEATVLMSDLRDFTTIAEGLPPAEVFDLLNEVHGRLAEAVRASGGAVDKFMGDGMLAVFGVPDAGAHAARALRAASAMLAAMDELNATRRARGLPAVKLGIGVHSGMVVAGCIGSGVHLEFTVLGDTVNTASRLEAVTKELGVALVVSEATVRLAGQSEGLRPVGTVAIRGRSEGLVVYARKN